MVALVLASASPRRSELLDLLGVSFEQSPADIDESLQPGESPQEYVVRLAREKSAAAQRSLTSDRAVLAADTTVVLDDSILGKPADRFDAMAMLARLSGREHRVLTAVCVRRTDQVEEALSESRVKFVTLSHADCEAYIASGEVWDKAGSYGIQGLGGAFVESISGSYSGIVGLPLHQTRELLQRVGVSTRLDAGEDAAP